MTDISTEIAEIQQVMREDNARYWRDEGMRTRLRELYEAQEVGEKPASRGKDELAEIEKVMRTDMDRYWRDPAMQARYRALLEQEEDADEAAAPGVGELAPHPTLSDWIKAGNDPADYGTHDKLVRATNDLLVAMEPAARDALDESFAKLPERVRAVAFGALLDRRAVVVTPFSDGDMAVLKQAPVLQSLAREWRHEAPMRLARVQERLWRVVERLGEQEAHSIIRWFDSLPRSAALALCRQLAR